jgi:hypothetical protein
MSIPNGNIYHFGILMSTMHMAWVKTTCGRLESRYRYSKDIVYNNFPWPENLTDKDKKNIEQKAQKVLKARTIYPNSTLAELYEPLVMPQELLKAHQELNNAVDNAYSKQSFTTDAKRMEFLFDLYEKYPDIVDTPAAWADFLAYQPVKDFITRFVNERAEQVANKQLANEDMKTSDAIKVKAHVAENTKKLDNSHIIVMLLPQ